MGKQQTHKAQHFVPKAYLAAWSDPDTPLGQTPYVWIFDKESGEGKRRAPSNIFTETDFYTIIGRDGRRDLTLEQGLGGLETGIKSLRIDFLEKKKGLPSARHIKLCAFTSAMRVRTAGFRNGQKEQWTRLLDLGKELEQSMAAKSASERKRAALASLPPPRKSMTLEQVETIVRHPIQTLLIPYLEAELPILSQMQMYVFSTTEEQGFITGDDPVTWSSPAAAKRGFLFRSPSLLDSDIEVTLPISPSQALLFAHTRPISRGIKPIIYVDAKPEIVLELNRRTFFHCRQNIVTCRNIYKPEWAEPVAA